MLTSQMIERGDLRIELLAFHEPGVVGSPSQRRNQLGLTHLCFYVDNVDEAAERMLEHGAFVLDSTRANLGTDIVFLMDPDGVRIELMRGAPSPPVPPMPDVEVTDDDEQFRRRRREVAREHVVGEYAELRGRGGPGDEDFGFDTRVRWERELGRRGSSASGGRSSTVVGAPPCRSRSSGPRSTPVPRRRRASTTWARTCSRRRSSSSGRTSSRSGSCRRSCAARSDGARATASPTRDRTSRGCRPEPCSTVTSGCSPARRSGRRSRTCPTGAS